MASKRRQPRPRAIPPHDATWSEREARQARAGAVYIADLDGVAPRMHWVIRNRETGAIVEHCPTATKSEVEDRAALLNHGEPTRADNQKWGKLTKERARPGKGVKSQGRAGPSPTEWVERLVNDPMGETSKVLRAYAAEARPITLAELQELLCKVGHERNFTETLLEAVSMQLYRKFGIRRAEEGKIAASHKRWSDET